MPDKLFQMPNSEEADPGLKTLNKFEAPIPGESLTSKPGSKPYERPPQYTEPEEALDFLFSRLMQRRVGAEILAYIESGVPVDMLAHMLIMSGFGEGKWPVTVVHQMAGPVVVMLTRMADAAKIKWHVSTDTDEEELPDILNKLAAQKVNTQKPDAAALGLDKLQRGGGLMGLKL